MVLQRVANRKRGNAAKDTDGIRLPGVITAGEDVECGVWLFDEMIAGSQTQDGAQVQELKLVIFEIRAAVGEGAVANVVLVERASANVVGGDAGSHAGSDLQATRSINGIHVGSQLVMERGASGIEAEVQGL